MPTSEENATAIVRLLNSEIATPEISEVDSSQVIEVASELMDALGTPFVHSRLVEHGVAGIISDRVNYQNVSKIIRNVGDDVLRQIMSSVISYFVNFAEKDLVVECFSAGFTNRPTSDLASKTVSTLSVKTDHLSSVRLKRDQELQKLGEHIVLHETAEAWTLFFLDSLVTQESVTVDDSWITPAGRSEETEFFARVNFGKYAFHKVILPKTGNRRIFLISPRTYAPRKNESVQKLTALKVLVEELFPVEEQERIALRPMYFFPIIQKLYENENRGYAGEAEFFTARGNRINVVSATAASDLREDPYHVGGAANNSTPVKPYKLRFRWLDFVGRPELRLNGRSDMCDKPNTSLPVVRVVFGFKLRSEADFLKEPLSYVEP